MPIKRQNDEAAFLSRPAASGTTTALIALPHMAADKRAGWCPDACVPCILGIIIFPSLQSVNPSHSL